jgi:hypothetical protein
MILRRSRCQSTAIPRRSDRDQAWIGWLEAIALLGLRDLAPLVHAAWDEGRVPPDFLERSEFEQDLVEAELRPDDWTDSANFISAISRMWSRR